MVDTLDQESADPKAKLVSAAAAGEPTSRLLMAENGTQQTAEDRIKAAAAVTANVSILTCFDAARSRLCCTLAKRPCFRPVTLVTFFKETHIL